MINSNKTRGRLFSRISCFSCFSYLSYLSFFLNVSCYQSPHRIIEASIRDITNIYIPLKSPSSLGPVIAFDDSPFTDMVEGYDGRYSDTSCNNTTEIETIQQIFYLAKRLKQLQDRLIPLEQRETLAKEILDEDAGSKCGGRHHMAPNMRNGGLFNDSDEWNFSNL